MKNGSDDFSEGNGQVRTARFLFFFLSTSTNVGVPTNIYSGCNIYCKLVQYSIQFMDSLLYLVTGADDLILEPTVNKDFESIYNVLKKVQVSADTIRELIGDHNEVLRRAWRRLEGGHLDLDSLEMREGYRVADTEKKQKLIIVSVDVVASLRNMRHRLRLCIDKRTLQILRSPVSICYCEVGAMGDCAHMATIYMYVYCCCAAPILWRQHRAQLNCIDKVLSIEDFKRLFPPVILTIQNLPTRWNLINGFTQRRKKQKLHKRAMHLREAVACLGVEEEGDPETGGEEPDNEHVDIKKAKKLEIRDIGIKLDQWIVQRFVVVCGSNNTSKAPSAHRLSMQEIEDDNKEYLSQFPRDEREQYKQDCMLEHYAMECQAMHAKGLEWMCNMAHYAIFTTDARHRRMRNFLRRHGHLATSTTATVAESEVPTTSSK